MAESRVVRTRATVWQRSVGQTKTWAQEMTRRRGLRSSAFELSPTDRHPSRTRSWRTETDGLGRVFSYTSTGLGKRRQGQMGRGCWSGRASATEDHPKRTTATSPDTPLKATPHGPDPQKPRRQDRRQESVRALPSLESFEAYVADLAYAWMSLALQHPFSSETARRCRRVRRSLLLALLSHLTDAQLLNLIAVYPALASRPAPDL